LNYRIITNLQCNKKCSFCYQKYKPIPDIILKKEKLITFLKNNMNKYGKLTKANIMGGESLLLSDICDYVEIIKFFAENICLITNGSLLDEDKLIKLKKSGLTDIAISISSVENYQEMRPIILSTKKHFQNRMRINLPSCGITNYKILENLVKDILYNDIYCLICEDINDGYSNNIDNIIINKWQECYKIESSDNYFKYVFNNKEFGLANHHENYDDEDLIISPLGEFSKWSEYFKLVKDKIK
jgi:pyruvate formate-lyase activating enzyme-like uncharacterized protein